MTLLQRRRALMMAQQAAPSGGTPVTGLDWLLGKNINSSGTINNGAFAAVSLRVPAQAAAVKRTGQAAYDGTEINCFLHEYDRTNAGLSSTGWLKRTQLYVGDPSVTLDSRTTHIAFTFAFPSGAGKTMTQDIVDQRFGAERVD